MDSDMLVWGAIWGVGIVIVFIIISIRTAVSSAGARKLLRKAEAAEAAGELAEAIKHYKDLLLAVAANEDEFPVLLSKLEDLYRRKSVLIDSSDILAAHKVFSEIWGSKMSDGEKRRLHNETYDGVKAKLDALP